MEVSQAICLNAFLIGALLISPKRFDEIILDFYQDAGIWIVIASCVAEYLLLLTYIGVAAYDFFKNRKMMKKMNVQRRTYEFLKFDESHRDVGNRLQTTSGGWLRHAAANKIEIYSLKQRLNTPNNPQLLKRGLFSSPVQLNAWNNKTLHSTSREALLRYAKQRRMNKSLKRKQIE